MLKGPKLIPEQWRSLASVAINLSQAIILFALAAIFVPEAINLSRNFSRLIASGFLACGLILLATGVTIIRKGKSQ